ncbi:MAG TPA: ribosome small subunit-dependent GTPase A [Steroidobacteraceae bacterium]|nr:ribosome small subunit-dependent GTPase A [Steroidobacteraceae bacterium]
MPAAHPRVVECFGRRVVLELPDHSHAQAEVFGKRLKVVCGDEVRAEHHPATHTLQVMEVLPRRTHLSRTDSRGQAEVLAANITQLVVLISEQPKADPFIVDRYLAGAELGDIKAVVVATKADLGRSTEFLSMLDEYRNAGYEVFDVAAGHETAGGHLDQLRRALKDETSMLAGESGVGKSTLTNALLGREHQLTRELSDATGEGRHTTVSSVMTALPSGGALIDSPGVRDYAPPPVNDLQVAFAWREFRRYAGQCKFNNCLHLREPGCAIIAAVAGNEISSRRYESYKRLINLMRQLLPSYERR